MVGTPEYRFRENVFLQKLRVVREHNADPSQTWKRGVNQFTDFSEHELKHFNLGVRIDHKSAPGVSDRAPTPMVPESLRQQVYISNPVETTTASQSLPFGVDWRLANSPRVLTAIKSQGYCGDCWGHSVTESMETYYAMLSGELHVLSQQQVTSCTNNSKCWKYNGTYIQSGGCSPNAPQRAFDSIRQLGGLHSNWVYPFVDFFRNTSNSSKCRNSEINWRPVVTAEGYRYVQNNNATAMMEALATVGPVLTFVAAYPWMDYEGGIFRNNASFGIYNFITDHVVQVVGYGQELGEHGLKYWIVRNTFGAGWGEAGYIRLERPDVEPCGLDGDTFRCGTELTHQVPVCGTSAVLSDPMYPVVKPAS